MLVIKAHLISEYYLNQLIALEDINFQKLNYPGKIDRTTSAESTLNIVLYALNKLRNKIGHELDYALSESDIDGLGYKLYSKKEYVIKKYDTEDKMDLLRAILVSIIIKLSVQVEIKIKQIKNEMGTEKKVVSTASPTPSAVTP